MEVAIPSHYFFVQKAGHTIWQLTYPDFKDFFDTPTGCNSPGSWPALAGVSGKVVVRLSFLTHGIYSERMNHGNEPIVVNCHR